MASIMNSPINKTTLYLCIIFSFFLASCSNSNSGQQNEVPSLPFQTVESANIYPSQVTGGLYIIRSISEWSNFWSVLKASYTPQPPLPSVNFTENVVISVVDSPRPTGGYSITITSVQTSSTGAIVQAVHQSPGQNCMVTQAFTQSDHIITAPTFSGEATLNLTEIVQDCAS